MQERFLRHVNLPVEDALAGFNLAPLAARRDMAMLGLIHRARLGKGPTQLSQYFRDAPRSTGRTRRVSNLHSRQVCDWVHTLRLDTTRRSALGLVQVYNALPQRLVDAGSEKSFQAELQWNLKRKAAMGGSDRWHLLFSPRVSFLERLRFLS